MVQNKYIVSKPYMVDPSNVKYDPKISSFNPPKGEKEYKGLLAQIKRSGQTTPAYMKDGLLGDGVHRTRACAELGIQLMVVDIDSNIPEQDYILMCNENTFASRNDTPTQLAIKGLAMVDQFDFTDAEVVRLLGLQNRKMIGYARTVRDSQYNKVNQVLSKLKAGEAVNIDGKHTKSLETVKRLIAKLEEAEPLASVVTEIEGDEVRLDYNPLLNTETAREKFWGYMKKTEIERNLEYIKYLNYVYKCTESTGDIRDSDGQEER